MRFSTEPARSCWLRGYLRGWHAPSLSPMLALRLFTRLARSSPLYNARSKALHEERSLQGSLQSLLRSPAPRLSKRIACSRALYRACSLRGSLRCLRGSESHKSPSPMRFSPTTPAPPRLAPRFSTGLAQYKVCSLQGFALYKAMRLCFLRSSTHYEATRLSEALLSTRRHKAPRHTRLLTLRGSLSIAWPTPRYQATSFPRSFIHLLTNFIVIC